MKHERSAWALDLIGQIDPALIDEADRAPLRRRHPLRRAILVAAILLCCTAITVGAALMHDPGEIPPANTTAAPSETASPDPDNGEIYDGVQAFQSLHIRWAGVSYVLQRQSVGDIRPGVQLGTVHIDNTHSCTDTSTRPEEYDRYLTASNVIPPGGAIYTCDGTSAAWRICGYDRAGELCIFEARGEERLIGQPLYFYFPAPSHIASLTLCDRDLTPLNEITDPDDIAWVIDRLREEARFVDRETANAAYRAAEGIRILELEITLTDGSKTTVHLYDNGYGSWIDPITLPVTYFESLLRHMVVYDAGDVRYGSPDYGQDRGFDYGNTVADNIYLLPEAYRDYDDLHAKLEGTKLYLTSSNGRNEYFLIANDAAGDIRIEELDIFYRRTDGKIARIRYDCPGLSEMAKKLQRGEDMTDYITAYEIVDDGRNIRFQLRAGIRWTLTDTGELKRNGETVARDVRDFCLDASGVIWAAADGAYRQLYANGTTVRLCTGEVRCVATSGLYVYCAMADGNLSRVRCDGAWIEPMTQLAAVELAYTTLYGGYSAGPLVLTETGEVWLLANGRRYLVDDGVTAIDAYDGSSLALIYRDGRIARARLDCYDGRNVTWNRGRLRETDMIR